MNSLHDYFYNCNYCSSFTKYYIYLHNFSAIVFLIFSSLYVSIQATKNKGMKRNLSKLKRSNTKNVSTRYLEDEVDPVVEVGECICSVLFCFVLLILFLCKSSELYYLILTLPKLLIIQLIHSLSNLNTYMIDLFYRH
jgi:hypothetical protein